MKKDNLYQHGTFHLGLRGKGLLLLGQCGSIPGQGVVLIVTSLLEIWPVGTTTYMYYKEKEAKVHTIQGGA